MTIDVARFQGLLSGFKLEQLFNELGWDHANLHPQNVSVNGEDYTLSTIAQKRGVAVLLCSPDGTGNIPARPTLLKIEKEATKLAHEHLLIFTDADKTTLTWLWVLRTPGQPAATRTHTWHKGTSGESLRQKLNQIVWSLEEEEAITLTDVITGLRQAFDRDKVSKKFYARFKTEHDVFTNFIEGLTAATDQAWYASLMLNRLMFVYFIQRKGFLDGNTNYLADRMQKVRDETGEGHFHTFYRLFLRRLFHEGLGLPKDTRGSDLTGLIGDVPYLNGGLFDVHELEEANPDIDIPDEAFERLFEFFDAYDWHLDDHPLSTGNEINPDVLGYIFEKYINQKQMGAYYTKEDITEYISKNTVIPHLLKQVQERCKVAFDGDDSVWNLLKADPGRYIYPAMKTGVIDAKGEVVPESELPDFVQTGMKDAKARMFERRYNLGEALFHTATGERGTLPTETWREYVERRTRCLDVRDKLAHGEVKSACDLVTLNLDIRQFMQDVIDTCTGPDLLRAVWQAIVGRIPEKANEKFCHGITILDPTCGSGAFLFAALNVLEPLYEGCLDRMEGFVEDARKLGKPVDKRFTKVLEEVGHHHSRRYFIYKSIILHNLFGVDIMAEAVEICELRLFLKLVSQVESGRELEPLPDMDFNIRTGNTLVGYVTEAQFDTTNNLASDQAHRSEIKASMADLADLFDRFREQQTIYGGKVTSEDKRALRDKLNRLDLELDRYLAHDYGIDAGEARAFAAWQTSHQPFHWFAEFYGVMRGGGFDVVIGNPPYVEYSKVRSLYTVRGFLTLSCGNLYAMVFERSIAIIRNEGKIGLIVPHSVAATYRASELQELMLNKLSAHFSYYTRRPGKLFDGADQCLCIVIGRRSDDPDRNYFSTTYRRWYTEERPKLFALTSYVSSPLRDYWDRYRVFPKLGHPVEIDACDQLSTERVLGSQMVRSGSEFYCHRIARYFIKATDFVPYFCSERDGVKRSDDFKVYGLTNPHFVPLVTSALSSSMFYWFWRAMFDGYHCGKDNIQAFPFDPQSVNGTLSKELEQLAENLMEGLKENAQRKTVRYRGSGVVEYDEFNVKASRPVVDKIDLVLAKHYKFSDQISDFIINYDIKYRIGGFDDET